MFVYSFNENQYLAELTFVLYIQFDIYAIKIYNVKLFIYAMQYFYISLIFCTFSLFLFDLFYLYYFLTVCTHQGRGEERERLCFNQLKNSPAGQQALLQVYLLIIQLLITYSVYCSRLASYAQLPLQIFDCTELRTKRSVLYHTWQPGSVF